MPAVDETNPFGEVTDRDCMTTVAQESKLEAPVVPELYEEARAKSVESSDDFGSVPAIKIELPETNAVGNLESERDGEEVGV